MLKAEVTKEYTKLELCGDLSDICSDLTHVLSAINERLSEKDAKLGHMFRVMFTKGFMDGVMFDDDREHMKHYLAEGDSNLKKNEGVRDFAEFLEGFIDFLKERRNELEKANEELKKQLGKDNDDEAE